MIARWGCWFAVISVRVVYGCPKCPGSPRQPGHLPLLTKANRLLQNLVPLVLWPLRLVLPAEQLRTARIVLLKATHFPFVALILGWESWRLYWLDRPGAKSSFGRTSRGSGVSNALRRPPLQHPLFATGPRQTLLVEQTPLVEQTRAARSPVVKPLEDPVETPGTIEALEIALDNLRTQLESISALLLREKRARAQT